MVKCWFLLWVYVRIVGVISQIKNALPKSLAFARQVMSRSPGCSRPIRFFALGFHPITKVVSCEEDGGEAEHFHSLRS
jgi:hypothetical protein